MNEGLTTDEEHVHRSRRPPQGLGKVLTRTTEFVEGKADLSYLELCLKGPCVKEGIGFNLMFVAFRFAILSCLIHIFS